MPAAKLSFFYSGKGDTILLRASCGKARPDDWALIDCCLTEDSGADVRIRNVIADEKITKLKFVCLTHPHRDHYLGMRRLLKGHFYDKATGCLKVDEFWDSGVNFEVLAAIAESTGTSEVKKEIDELYKDFLVRLILANKLVQCPMYTGTLSTITFGDFHLLSLSPRFNRVKRFNLRGVSKALGISRGPVKYRYEEINDLSVILVLMHKTLPVNIVLGADATADAWVEALDAWAKVLKKLDRGKSRFAAVKVSHHGAAASLHPSLYEDYCWAKKTVAILTVGPGDSNHPHQDVLDLLHSRNIRTYATCWPTATPVPAKPHMPLPGFGASKVGQLRGHDWADIDVIVEQTGRLKVVPGKSRIL